MKLLAVCGQNIINLDCNLERFEHKPQSFIQNNISKEEMCWFAGLFCIMLCYSRYNIVISSCGSYHPENVIFYVNGHFIKQYMSLSFCP